MKDIAKILSGIDGISIYPIIGLIICFGIFSLVVFYIFTTKKDHFNEVQNLPLDDEDAADSKTNKI